MGIGFKIDRDGPQNWQRWGAELIGIDVKLDEDRIQIDSDGDQNWEGYGFKLIEIGINIERVMDPNW